MAKIVIEGQKFDTSKATKHISIAHHDGHNMIYGEIYKSSKGTWYVYTPSQWSNGHHWMITTPEQIMEDYRDMLNDEEIALIAEDVEGWE